MIRATARAWRGATAGAFENLLCFLMFIVVSPLSSSAEPRNLNDIPNDLQVPPVIVGTPQLGARVWRTNPNYKGWKVAHAIYLPTDWKQGKRYPVLFEFPGNGNYQNVLGDHCDGTVEGCEMGYGLSAGRGMIWVSLPFVDPKTRAHARQWWGDPDETAKYCCQAAVEVCREYGGDPKRLVLIGFSRGAIACNYIGLRNDEIASLWCGFIAHSHYDGVRPWDYADSDAASARKRLHRLGARPQLISHEVSAGPVEDYLKHSCSRGAFTFAAIPYRNHSSSWVLKDLPMRDQARNWLKRLVQE